MRVKGWVLRGATLGAVAAVLCGIALGACGDDDSSGDDAAVDAGPDALALPPDRHCPGDPACADTGDGVLHVGAAVVDLTPQDLMEGPSFVDANGDGEYNEHDGDTFVDQNGNGDLDAMWIAGFGQARPATGVHDPLEGRIVVLRQNETTIVWVAVDFIGFFLDYIDEVRSRLSPATQEQVDLVLVSATHDHQAPDTLGIFGASYTETGLNLEYLDWVSDQLADGIEDAVAALEPAHVTYGAIQVQDPDGETYRYVGDGRDPMIIDLTMNVMRFFRPGTDDTIATVVNFASHPEWVGSRNNLISADYPYYLREAVESGDTTGIQGIGGICMFVNGALGGQIGPNGTIPLDRAGNEVYGDSFEAAQAAGESYAEFALKALLPENGAVTDETADLFFRTRRVYAHIDNHLYQAVWRLGIFNRTLYNFDPEAAIDETNVPEIISELVYLRIGQASLISAPGELHPELFIGCYDGSCSGSQELLDPGNENPPDLSQAPEGPYLRDLVAVDGSTYQWLLGMTQDELGYIMPDYNFILAPVPYLDEAPGEHYEETNSLGPRARTELIDPLIELITYDH